MKAMKARKYLSLLTVAVLATATIGASSAAHAENSAGGVTTNQVQQAVSATVSCYENGTGRLISTYTDTFYPDADGYAYLTYREISGYTIVPGQEQQLVNTMYPRAEFWYDPIQVTPPVVTTEDPIPPVITTEEPAPPVVTTVEPPVATTVAPPVVTTAEPPVVTTTQEQPATTQATTEEEPTTTANNGGNTQTTTTEPITTTTDDGGNGGTTTTQTTTEPVVTTANNGGGGAQNTTQEPKTTVQAPKSGDKPKVNQPKTDAPKKDQPKAEPKATEAPAPAKQTVKPNGVAVAKTAADTAASGLTNSKSSVVGYLAAMLMAVVGFVLLLGYNPKEEK